MKGLLAKRSQNWLPLLAILTLLPIWEGVCRLFAVPTFILPAPSDIALAFTQVSAERWLDNLWATLRIALFGFALSFALSIPLAIMMVNSKFLTRAIFPLLVVIQSTPVVAIAPLLIVILGTGDAPRLAITCLITFFPLVVSATTGMLATPPELIELSHSLNVSNHKTIWQIRLPYAIPHIFSGVKVAITLAVIGSVIAEFVAAEKGLGYLVQFSTSYFKIPQAFAALVFLSVVSMVLFKSVSWIQKGYFAWSLSDEEKQR
ncbi:ABC transporter permease [Vibrio fluvialis]|nr:ABC transporter permease [Vibrio fluvialis]MBY8061093.1 ABC transporter permease [Vibrio fluvialis]